MNLKMLIESDPHETRVALLEQDRLAELFIERHQQLGVVGNIYLGRVSRVLPGMQAAFVNIGLDRDAFLYVSEVGDPLLTVDEIEKEAETDEARIETANGDIETSSTNDSDTGISSAEISATANVTAAATAAAAANTEAHSPESEQHIGEQRATSDRQDRPSIDQLLKQGQEVMVQVLKDALPNKGARVSTQITLPGRSLVFLPNMTHLGVSRRIEDEDERLRLRTILEEMQPASGGLIVRTAGEGGQREDFESDLAYLTQLWDRIRRRGEKMSAPTLLHRDLDLALRVVRDYLAEEYSVIWVDGVDTYERVVDFVDQVQPSLLGRVKLFQQDAALFERFAVDHEIEAALKTKVWLKSGGHIVIHPTEALVAIDVNTGRYVGRHNLEETVLTTNLEAVQEIVRQLRLRNLGGIIVIDLIDMVEPVHRERVFEALAAEMAKDRAKNKVLNISEFGLVEITRKRTRPSLERTLTQPCPYCRGTRRIKSLSTICLDLRRQLLRHRQRYRDGEILLRVHPDVSDALQKQNQPVLREIESELDVEILIQSDSGLHHERFDILEV